MAFEVLELSGAVLWRISGVLLFVRFEGLPDIGGEGESLACCCFKAEFYGGTGAREDEFAKAFGLG